MCTFPLKWPGVYVHVHVCVGLSLITQEAVHTKHVLAQGALPGDMGIVGEGLANTVQTPPPSAY